MLLYGQDVLVSTTVSNSRHTELTAVGTGATADWLEQPNVKDRNTVEVFNTNNITTIGTINNNTSTLRVFR